MLKRIFALSIISVFLLILVSCGSSNVKNKESVSVKQSDLYSDYHLKESTVSNFETFEKDGVRTTLSGITYEDVITKINFAIKNDTDKNVKVVTTDLAINGLMCTDAMMIDVSAKSEKNGFIEISNEWFAELNIDVITDLEYVIRVLDEKTDEIARSKVFKVKTDASKEYRQSYNEEGFVIYNKGGIVFSARELKKSKLSNDLELSFYVENNTDKPFSIMANEVMVNGKIVEPLFVITVGAKKKAVDSMLFYGDDLDALAITEFTSVKASFKAISDALETVFETESIEIPVK